LVEVLQKLENFLLFYIVAFINPEFLAILSLSSLVAFSVLHFLFVELLLLHRLIEQLLPVVEQVLPEKVIVKQTLVVTHNAVHEGLDVFTLLLMGEERLGTHQDTTDAYY
jgi:hypothetical protein